MPTNPRGVFEKAQVWKALLFIFGAFVVIAILAPKDNQESSKNVITRYVNRDAIGAVNPGDIELLADASEHDDLAAEIALVDRGKALQVPKGTRVELIDSQTPGDSLPKVSIRSGVLIGRTCYLPRETLSTFNPWDTSGAYGNPGSGNPWEGAAAAAKAAAEKEAHGTARGSHD